MRRIEPLPFASVRPADLSGMKQPGWDLVDPRDLYIEDTYQRNIRPRSRETIGRIRAHWRWSRFKPPVCCRADGKLCVVDGQHTAIAAASHPDITVIPVVIVDEPETRDHAAAFVSHARDRLAATPAQVHRAEVAAGDSDAAAVQAVCDRPHVILRQFPLSVASLTGRARRWRWRLSKR